MNIKYRIVFVLIFVQNAKSNREGDDICTGYTINHNYPSSDFAENTNNNNNVQRVMKGLPGSPGKRGPTGLRGEKGEIGNVGPQGPSTDPQVLERLIDERVFAITGSTKTCAYKEPGPSGNYFINPDPSTTPPFLAYCNFSDPENPATVFGHDFLTEQPVENCEDHKCSNQAVTYQTNLQKIISVINASLTCRQHIKVRCIDSALWYMNDHSPRGAWVSRDGVDRHYWGGASRDFYCACGESGTCDDTTKKCNCDKNTDVETSDEGYLTNKDLLPVIGLKHGDASGGNGEFAWHTLGMLECFGKA